MPLKRCLTKQLLATLGLLGLLGWSLPASSATVTYDFAGACADCTGTGLGELVLNDYTPGDNIDRATFVSFHYDGTDLLPAFTIDAANETGVFGTIPADLPQAATVGFNSADNYFLTAEGGFWCAGGGAGCFADLGFPHLWSVQSIPEPISLALLAPALFGLATARRRHARRS